ncbi:MAG: hypothetical protein JSS36_10350 [Proteobacteria bacterium]|nr:hypothetical protein [Pseudomonadota bacterium]
MADSEQLLEIHAALTGDGRGRRYDVDALNRGAVILSVAAWEAFVEDLALYSARRLSLGLSGARKIPDVVKEPFLAWLHASTDFKNPTPAVREAMWSLTGQGWRQVFRKFAEDRVKNFSTPSPNDTKKLFRCLIGIDDITGSWGYQRWGSDVYRTRLDATLLLRHRIAHGAIGTETVGKTNARSAIRLVSVLSERTSAAVTNHLNGYDLNFRRRR